jgi:hypothetical protein
MKHRSRLLIAQDACDLFEIDNASADAVAKLAAEAGHAGYDELWEALYQVAHAFKHEENHPHEDMSLEDAKEVARWLMVIRQAAGKEY